MDKSKFNDKKELRNFAIVLGIILGLIGTIRLMGGKESYLFFFLSGIVIIFLGLALPSSIKPLFILFSYIGLVMGKLMNGIILTFLFYFLFTPFGFLLKLSGKDFLNLKITKNENSYWIKRKNVKFEKSSYENQF